MRNSKLRGVGAAMLVAVFAALVLSMSPEVAAEGGPSPIGVWETVDDNTGEAKSHVRIWERGGKLYGKIVKLLRVADDAVCDNCRGNKKNQPLLGMMIMWNLEKSDDGWYDDGRIMDPDNGKTYRCKIKVTSGGRKLDVRGYLGISLFGRTQTWNRVR